MRSSAAAWSSTLTPSQTFGSGSAMKVPHRRGAHHARIARPLREDLEHVAPPVPRHHAQTLSMKLVGHVLVEEVAHAVHEDAPRPLPLQRLLEQLGHERTSPVHTGPPLVSLVRPS
jgi:hypothetical protein